MQRQTLLMMIKTGVSSVIVNSAYYITLSLKTPNRISKGKTLVGDMGDGKSTEMKGEGACLPLTQHIEFR